MVWNQAQQSALAIVPKFTSFLSLLGSSWVIVEVLTEREKMQSVYHRLLLAMSIYDVLESVWNFASTWPIVRGTPNIWGASGTTQSCTTQGFFLQLGLAIPMYNAFLSIYYLLVIKYNMPDARLRKRVEPPMHVAAFVFAGGTAFAAIGLKLFNSANLWCWIAPLPQGCLDSWRHGADGNCTRGDNAFIYRWGFYFAPLWFCLFLSTIVVILVFRTVRKREEASVAFRHPTVARMIAPNGNPAQGTSTGGGSGGGGGGSGIAIQRSASFRGTDYLDSDRNVEQEDESNERRTTWQEITHQSSLSVSKLRKAYRDWREQRARYREENPRSIEVFHQALCYLGAFYMTHVFSTINRIMQQRRGESYFALIVLHAFFDPLQGFLNFLVYQRPRYLRHRKQNISRSQAIKRALKWSWLTEWQERRLQHQVEQVSSLAASSKPSSSLYSNAKSEASKSASSNGSKPRISGLLLMTQSLEPTKGQEDGHVQEASVDRMETVNEVWSSASQ